MQPDLYESVLFITKKLNYTFFNKSSDVILLRWYKYSGPKAPLVQIYIKKTII